MNTLATAFGGERLYPEPYIDAPSARDYILELGRIYLDAGLPLASAFEAALADYHSLGAPAAGFERQAA